MEIIGKDIEVSKGKTVTCDSIVLMSLILIHISRQSLHLFKI